MSDKDELRELTVEDLAAVRSAGAAGEKGKGAQSKFEGGTTMKAEDNEFENGVIEPPIIQFP